MLDISQLTTWASLPALSPHEIAQLNMGVAPDGIEPGVDRPHGRPPSLNYDLEELGVTSDELLEEYQRTYLLLIRGIEVGKITCTVPGKISPEVAMTYLQTNAKENKWEEWLFASPFYQAVSTKTPATKLTLDTELAELKRQVNTLETEIETLRHRRPYRNTLLDWLDAVIDQHFYDGIPTEGLTKDAIVEWIVKGAAAKESEVTSTAARAIATILTPDARRKGGRPSTK